MDDGKAAINGDIAMTAEEVNPVVRTVRENDIRVVALHNHRLEEESRLFFVHFWAIGGATTLAKRLRKGRTGTPAQRGVERRYGIQICINFQGSADPVAPVVLRGTTRQRDFHRLIQYTTAIYDSTG